MRDDCELMEGWEMTLRTMNLKYNKKKDVHLKIVVQQEDRVVWNVAVG